MPRATGLSRLGPILRKWEFVMIISATLHRRLAFPILRCCGGQLVQSGDNLLAMNAKFLVTFPWFRAQSNNDLGQNFTSASTLEQPEHKTQFDVKLWGLSLLSLFPLAVKGPDKIQGPTTINRKLKRRSQSRVAQNDGGVYPLRFRPYVSKVPWHTGVRGFLSQLFPRYGHYCGPNWSSGKDNGSLVWDKRPIDWLDFCCYCHDIGYDSHDQTELLKADLAFMECLERPHMITRGDAHTAAIYKTMCINGMKNLLIPYRRHLIKLQSGESLVQFGWLSNIRWRGWNLLGTKN